MDAYLHQPLNNAEWATILMLVSIVCGTAVTIASIVTAHYRRTQLNDIEATLKLEMLSRGMGADDIKKVLQARSSWFDPQWMAECGKRSACGKRHWKHYPSSPA